MVAATKEAGSSDGTGLRGPVLDVLRELLAENRGAEIIALVTKLVSRNHELELLLAKLRESHNRGEHVSSAQLALCLEGLRKASQAEQAQANQKLEKAARENAGRPEATRPPPQPALRRKPSPALRRVDNPIAVPEGERPCPICGALRKCIAHEITEVIDLIPRHPERQHQERLQRWKVAPQEVL